MTFQGQQVISKAMFLMVRLHQDDLEFKAMIHSVNSTFMLTVFSLICRQYKQYTVRDQTDGEIQGYMSLNSVV